MFAYLNIFRCFVSRSFQLNGRPLFNAFRICFILSYKRISYALKVLADEHGTVVNFGSDVRKDNTNLHMHHLFIGGEGQLGVVTGVTVCVVPKPISAQVAMLGKFFTTSPT